MADFEIVPYNSQAGKTTQLNTGRLFSIYATGLVHMLAIMQRPEANLCQWAVIAIEDHH